jgi:hypothetical protein
LEARPLRSCFSATSVTVRNRWYSVATKLVVSHRPEALVPAPYFDPRRCRLASQRCDGGNYGTFHRARTRGICSGFRPPQLMSASPVPPHEPVHQACWEAARWPNQVTVAVT